MSLSAASAAGSLTARLGAAKFGLLLAALLLLLVLQPFTGSMAGLAALDLALIAVLLTGLLAVSGRRVFLATGLALLVPCVGLDWIASAASSRTLDGVALGSHVAFMLFVTASLTGFVVGGRRVTLDTLLGATCVYLLIGLVFALIYAWVELWAPGSFALPQSMLAGEGSSKGELRALLYYSFVTLTTLGYGDINPLSDPARALSVGEAVVGQLYLALLIARLVGMHLAQAGDAVREG